MKKILNFRLIIILMLIGACHSRDKSLKEDLALKDTLTGGWITSNSNANPLGFVFLPNGRFEAENFARGPSGVWILRSDSLIILMRTVEQDQKFSFKMRFENGELLLNNSSDQMRFSRRPYGVNPVFLSDRFESITRGINQRNLNQAENIMELPASGNSEGSQILGLWENENTPEKLAATEPVKDNVFAGFSEYYFIEGHLICKKGPMENLLFENNEIVLWTDSLLNILQPTEIDLKSKAEVELEKVSRYLKAYGIHEDNGVFFRIEESGVSAPDS
ncbi:MAG TPA: hypothetical protein VGA21_04275 [Cyclobacteriaceae bacterium]